MLSENIYDLDSFNGCASDTPHSGLYPSLNMDNMDHASKDYNPNLDHEDSAMDTLQLSLLSLLPNFTTTPITVSYMNGTNMSPESSLCTWTGGTLLQVPQRATLLSWTFVNICISFFSV